MTRSAKARKARFARVAWLLLLAAGSSTVALLVPARPAFGCTCAGGTPLEVVAAKAEVVFIGRVVAQRNDQDDPNRPHRAQPVVLTFEVDEPIKGDVPSRIEVRNGSGGSDCGAPVEMGQQYGVLPHRWLGGLTIDSCGSDPVDPSAVRALTLAAPPVDGQGPAVMAVTGQFGPATLGLLDATGRPLGWMFGPGHTLTVTACRGGKDLALWWAPPFRPEFDDQLANVSVIDTSTLRVVWTRTSSVNPGTGGRDARPVSCVGSGLDARVAIATPGDPGGLTLITKDTDVKRDVGRADAAAFGPRGELIVAATAGESQVLIRSLSSQDAAERWRVAAAVSGTAKMRVAANRKGRVAVVAGSVSPGSESREAVILTADGREERRFDLASALDVQDVEWVDESRLALLSGGPSPTIQLYSAEGGTPTTFAVQRGGEWQQTAAVGDEMWLVSPFASIARVLPTGEIERRLGQSYTGSLVALPVPIEVDPALRGIVRPPDAKPATIVRAPAPPDAGTGEYPSRWLLAPVLVTAGLVVVLVMITVRRRRAMA